MVAQILPDKCFIFILYDKQRKKNEWSCCCMQYYMVRKYTKFIGVATMGKLFIHVLLIVVRLEWKSINNIFARDWLIRCIRHYLG
jgi:cbb3-type cytochrome oxidase subunit 3